MRRFVLLLASVAVCSGCIGENPFANFTREQYVEFLKNGSAYLEKSHDTADLIPKEFVTLFKTLTEDDYNGVRFFVLLKISLLEIGDQLPFEPIWNLMQYNYHTLHQRGGVAIGTFLERIHTLSRNPKGLLQSFYEIVMRLPYNAEGQEQLKTYYKIFLGQVNALNESEKKELDAIFPNLSVVAENNANNIN